MASEFLSTYFMVGAFITILFFLWMEYDRINCPLVNRIIPEEPEHLTIFFLFVTCTWVLSIPALFVIGAVVKRKNRLGYVRDKRKRNIPVSIERRNNARNH